MQYTKSDAKYVEELATEFVEEWNDAFDDPRVFYGELDALQHPNVKQLAELLEIEGYRMEHDAEKECWWLVSLYNGRLLDQLFY